MVFATSAVRHYHSWYGSRMETHLMEAERKEQVVVNHDMI